MSYPGGNDPYGQPGPYGQPNQPSQPPQYGQQNPYSQPDPYAQQSPYSQPGAYGQPGAQQPYGQPVHMLTAADYKAQGITPPLSQPLYGASMMEAYKRYWKKGIRFSGYASRSEFWWPQLINTIILMGPLVLIFIFSIIAGISAAASQDPESANVVGGIMGLLTILIYIFIFLLSLAMMIPSLAVGWRRLQDAGFPGALTFLSFVISIVPLVMCMLDTKPEARRPEWEDTRGD